MDVSTTAVLVYVVLQLAIGAWISRRIRTEEDYLVAGRRLGYTLSIFTIFATWFGAETCIGAAGVVYAAGLAGGTSDPFGYAVCLFVMGVAFSVPLWRARLTTVADLPRRRYSIAVERVTVLLMVPTSVFWAAAQVRAFGQVLSASSGLAVWVTITVAALVVVIYTVSGGLLADAWTDLLQGIVLIAGLLLLLGAALLRHGVEPFGAIDPARLRPLGGGQEPLLAVIEAWAIPVCGSVFAAELVARMIAARSPRVARRSTLVASGTYLLIGLIPVALGLFAAVTLPGLEHPEQVLPRLAHELLPAALYPVFAGALVSAILSTVDSSLLAASSLAAHNLVVPLRPGTTERRKVALARAGVVLFGILAYVLALYADGVYALVEQASAFGSSGIFVVMVFGLFTRIGGPASALAALVSGVAVWVAGAYWLELPYPYLASLAAALAAYLIPVPWARVRSASSSPFEARASTRDGGGPPAAGPTDSA